MAKWIQGLSRELLRASFCEYFGLSTDHVDILVVLYGHPNESIPIKKLRHLIDSHRPPTIGAIHERVRTLREVMEAESVDSGGRLNPEGYRLSEVGYGECRKAISHMAQILLHHERLHGASKSLGYEVSMA